MGDLARLIEAVEAGAISTDLIMSAIEEPSDQLNTLGAFDGYLDAAKALHDALLPGWIFDATNDSAFVMRPWDYHGEPPPQYGSEADNPARAWLLAILRALEAEENHADPR